MRFFRYFAFGLLALTLGLLVLGLLLPSRATLERSIVIERPPATVFTVLNGFTQFGQWSPWAELDPKMEVRLEGPRTGVGARYLWASNEASVGTGSQEIVESQPHRRIAVRLTFSGMSAPSLATYTLAPEAGGTRLVWGHEADFSQDFFARYFGLVLDAMVGKDYERGLARLKAHVETLPTDDFSALDAQVIEVPAQRIAYLSSRSSTGAGDIAKAYAESFQRISAALLANGIDVSGPVLVIGRVWDEAKNLYEFDAAIPVPADTAQALKDREVRLGQTYAGTVIRAVHKGAQDSLAAHLERLMAFKRAAGFSDNGAPWDVYVSSGASTPESERITETFVPVK